MQNRDEERQEILKRLNATEELLGMPKARTDAAEEERQRKFDDEIKQALEIYKTSGAWAGGAL